MASARSFRGALGKTYFRKNRIVYPGTLIRERLPARRCPDIGERGGQDRSCSSPREYFRQAVAEFFWHQICLDRTRGSERNRSGFLRNDDHDGVAVLGNANGRSVARPQLLGNQGVQRER